MRRFEVSKIIMTGLIAVSGLVAFGCGGGGRVLIVKSDPADADVCIKGKANSEHFSNVKSCVGSTPFEADRVELVSKEGGTRTVKFKDVEGARENFYVVVSRQGYATQAFEVPAWEHFVALKPEGGHGGTTVIMSGSQQPVAAAAAPAGDGSVKITSDPVGALVYINGTLKGNTPFTYSGAAGPVRLRLELEGYSPLEKTFNSESGANLALNFKMISAEDAARTAALARGVETRPIGVKDAKDRAPAAIQPAGRVPTTKPSDVEKQTEAEEESEEDETAAE